MFIPDKGTSPNSSGRIIGSIGRGRWMIGSGNGGAPDALDSLGRHIATVGRQGSGPGEFQSAIASAVGPGDSIAVVDIWSGRLNILSPTLRPVRSWGLPQNAVTGGVLWLPGAAGLLISGLRATPSEVGYSIHRYSSKGEYLGSISEERRQATSTSSRLEATRLLALHGSDTVVSVTVSGEYRIQKWRISSGELLADFVRDAPWLVRSGAMFRGRILSATIDTRGVLWTLSAALAEEWEKGVRPRMIGGTERSYEIIDRNKIFDSVIEAIDLSTGMLLAQLRTSRLYTSLLPGGLIASESEDPNAGPGFDFFRLWLTRP